MWASHQTFMLPPVENCKKRNSPTELHSTGIYMFLPTNSVFVRCSLSSSLVENSVDIVYCLDVESYRESEGLGVYRHP